MNINRVLFGVGATAALILGVNIYAVYGTQDQVHNAVVIEKERVVTGSGDNIQSRYLIFTEQEVFENTDSMLYLKFNSSDIYGRIKRGDVCSFQVYGWRVPFLSMYRNIVSADC